MVDRCSRELRGQVFVGAMSKYTMLSTQTLQISNSACEL